MKKANVCVAFRGMGHNAYSCDILPCSGGHPEWHIMGDVLPLLSGNCTFATADGMMHRIAGKWDMIIAFPPCTFMTAAGACRMYPTKGHISLDRFHKSQLAKQFFMEFWNADCDRIAIENPKPLKIVGLPKESQRIQPWEYAANESEFYTKQTYLWLKCVPPLEPMRTIKPANVRPFVSAGSKKANGERREMVGCKHSAIERSKTFRGVAEAMARQWG